MRDADLCDTQFHQTQTTMESINIAIIGAEGVGKSAFVQRSRRDSRPPSQNVTQMRYEVDGVQYYVTLVELDLEGIELDPRQPIQWPKQIGGCMVPRMDGALILYDVTDKETVRELETIMCECLFWLCKITLANSFVVNDV